MKIEVMVERVYGKDLVRPWNEAAQAAADLIGKRSFSASDLRGLMKLGHEVVEVSQPKLGALL